MGPLRVRVLLPSYLYLPHPSELPPASLALPWDAGSGDRREVVGELARLFASPEALPDSLVEALYAIDEMSTPEGQEQLEAAVAQAGLRIESGEGSTRHDLALQVWLAAPALLAAQSASAKGQPNSQTRPRRRGPDRNSNRSSYPTPVPGPGRCCLRCSATWRSQENNHPPGWRNAG